MIPMPMMHWNLELPESVDFVNCAHPIASIALQSFKVRTVMVAMMLSVLQKMK